jgi:RNA polymerase sigma-70 factor (ECF subfamily)
VDDQAHPELFWAIRGGGGNFGVATRFQFRLHPVQTIVDGILILPATPDELVGRSGLEEETESWLGKGWVEVHVRAEDDLQRRADEMGLISAAKGGDERAFAMLTNRYRRELRVHCYRMLGSFDDAEDLVQETLLRAWRGLPGFSFEGRWSFRAWLYRIATNACLKALARNPRRLLPWQLGPPGAPGGPLQPASELPWLQPYPDHLLEAPAPSADEPEAVAVAKETIELAFLATIQLLPPRQRAVLIVRDALGWSASEAASLLDTSVASVNSALQRARATLRERLPKRRTDWAPASDPTAEERAVLQRYIQAHERGDAAAVAELLREDARGGMPPTPTWFQGRDAIMAALAASFDPASPTYTGEYRCLPTRANRQPAAACYVRAAGDSRFRAFSLDVLRVEQARIVEVIGFAADRFPAFGLPPTL